MSSYYPGDAPLGPGSPIFDPEGNEIDEEDDGIDFVDPDYD